VAKKKRSLQPEKAGLKAKKKPEDNTKQFKETTRES